MTTIGGKRPAPDSETSDSGASEKIEVTPVKRPALSGFNFRPSPLQQATQGFSLKRSSLSSAIGATSTTGSTSKTHETAGTTPLQGGFLKLDSSELKPIAGTTTLAPVDPNSGFSSFGNSSGASSEANENEGRDLSEQVNHNESQTNLFLQFLNRTSNVNTFSLAATASNLAPIPSQPPNSSVGQSSTASEAGAAPTTAAGDGTSEDSGYLTNNLCSEDVDAAGNDFQGSSAVLPEVQVVTGEEKERKIVQVPARLYVFDLLTHTWKERGHGEIRLNDSARSEGIFQSRLVMRTLGSFRLLLNTYLWAHMKCDRASQKGIRITAQHGEEGSVGVFLVTGASKDIQQLFTAIDRRIEALQRNTKNSSSDGQDKPPESTLDQPLPQFEDDDRESFTLGEHNSSPESSPDCHVGSRTRHAPAIVSKPDNKDDQSDDPPCAGELSEKMSENDNANRADASNKMSATNVTTEECSGESEKESETATPASSRSPSEGASTTTTVSSSTDNANEASFSQ